MFAIPKSLEIGAGVRLEIALKGSLGPAEFRAYDELLWVGFECQQRPRAVSAGEPPRRVLSRLGPAGVGGHLCDDDKRSGQS